MAMQSGANYFFSKVDDFDELSLVVAGMVLKEINDNKILAEGLKSRRVKE
jgi:hypothetical protein